MALDGNLMQTLLHALIDKKEVEAMTAFVVNNKFLLDVSSLWVLMSVGKHCKVSAERAALGQVPSERKLGQRSTT